MTALSALGTIPIIDIRNGGPVRYALDASQRARALRDECVDWLPGGAATMLPVLDALTRAWLRRSRSPYAGEIETIASGLGFPGIWFLNGCYHWGCTALAREEEGVPWLARTLDWPFPGLGRRIEVAQMSGPAGRFDNVTWPGYAGVLTASAPNRFAAAINQAPMWRRAQNPWLRPLDFALNALDVWRIRFTPPDHLLREVFETCRSYGEARHRLETTPVARPVIYTLVGVAPGQRCLIERTEESFTTHTQVTNAANDWLHPSPHWEARLSAEAMLSRSYEETMQNSRARREHLAAFAGRLSDDGFAWVTPPILNPYTRIAVATCPARGRLRVLGYESEDGVALAQPATQARAIGASEGEATAAVGQVK
jgi:hypothetical protein